MKATPLKPNPPFRHPDYLETGHPEMYHFSVLAGSTRIQWALTDTGVAVVDSLDFPTVRTETIT